jgi:hypothetical protein
MVDPTGKDYVARAQSVGMLAGYFHFLTPGDGAAQADFFLDTAGDMTGMLIPFDDDEAAGIGNQTPIDFKNRVKERIGVTPGYYSMLSRIRQRSGLTDSPLWFADPDGNLSIPSDLGDWNQFVLKQNTFTPFDGDLFFGDMDALKQFTVGAPKNDGLGVVVKKPDGTWALAACNPVLNESLGVTDVDYAPIAALLGVPVVDGMLPRGPVRSFPGIQVTAHLDAQREYVYPTPAPGFPVIAADGKVAS